MDKAKTTPKDFFLWAGAMVALYWTVVSFILLIFNYIDYAFPNPLQNYYGYSPYSSGVGYEMASIIVLVPIFVLLMRLIHRNIERDPSRREIWVRRWALMLTLFIAGVTIAVDLIVLLTTFFNGEALTVAFLLKVVVVLLVAAAAFMHFIADLWNYWEKNPSYARLIGWATGVLALLSVAAGFVILGTPWQAQQYRMDELRVEHLQQIQSQVVYYYQQKEELPATLKELEDPISSFLLPMDPQTGAPYEYRATGATTFELCATFTAESQEVPGNLRPVYSDLAAPERWQHEAGNVCFTREIDPERYPPITPKVPTAI